MANEWVSFLERSYDKIKAAFISRLKIKIPENQDFSENNILIILIEGMAALVEQIHGYIDSIARESFLTSSRRLSSVIKRSKEFDYRIKASSGALGDVLVTVYDSEGKVLNILANLIIPKGTEFSGSGITFVSIKDVAIVKGTSYVHVPVQQKAWTSGNNLGTTTSAQSQKFQLPDNYHDDSLEITINGETWERVYTFGYSTPTSKHYLIDVNVDGNIYVVFGDGQYGQIPMPNNSVLGDYFTTLGTSGRVLSGSITAISTDNLVLTNTGISSFKVTNESNTVGGTDIEDINAIKRNCPISFRTLLRAVTRRDFTELALLVPGVAKSGLSYTSTDGLEIFVAPVGGGDPNSGLLTAVKEFYNEKCMIPHDPIIRPAGESEILLSLKIWGKYRKYSSEIKSQVTSVLTDNYSFNNADINTDIFLSDIQALVDNQTSVDHMKIVGLSIKPFARASQTTENTLSYSIVVTDKSTEVVTWKIYKNTDTAFQVYKNGVLAKDNLLVDTDWTDEDGIITLKINTGTYSIKDTWVFKTYPYNDDISLDDFTVPVLIEDNITYEIIESFSLES